MACGYSCGEIGPNAVCPGAGGRGRGRTESPTIHTPSPLALIRFSKKPVHFGSASAACSATLAAWYGRDNALGQAVLARAGHTRSHGGAHLLLRGAGAKEDLGKAHGDVRDASKHLVDQRTLERVGRVLHGAHTYAAWSGVNEHTRECHAAARPITPPRTKPVRRPAKRKMPSLWEMSWPLYSMTGTEP